MTKKMNDFDFENTAPMWERENCVNSNQLNNMKKSNNETVWERHEYCELFPEADELTLKALAEDIDRNGLYEPIITHEGKILDGWNRYRACQKANIDPQFTEYKKDDPLSYVLSKNASRRHLTTSQRAIIAAKMLAGGSGKKEKPQICGSSYTQNQVAVILSISERQVQEAARLFRIASPELIAEVGRDEKTIHAALKELKPAKTKPQSDAPPTQQSTPSLLDRGEDESQKADHKTVLTGVPPAKQGSAGVAEESATSDTDNGVEQPDIQPAQQCEVVAGDSKEAITDTTCRIQGENKKSNERKKTEVVAIQTKEGSPDSLSRDANDKGFEDILTAIEGVLDHVDRIFSLFDKASELAASEPQQKELKSLRDKVYTGLSLTASWLQKNHGANIAKT